MDRERSIQSGDFLRRRRSSPHQEDYQKVHTTSVKIHTRSEFIHNVKRVCESIRFWSRSALEVHHEIRSSVPCLVAFVWELWHFHIHWVLSRNERRARRQWCWRSRSFIQESSYTSSPFPKRCHADSHGNQPGAHVKLWMAGLCLCGSESWLLKYR